jgi:hypothetical protein
MRFELITDSLDNVQVVVRSPYEGETPADLINTVAEWEESKQCVNPLG